MGIGLCLFCGSSLGKGVPAEKKSAGINEKSLIGCRLMSFDKRLSFGQTAQLFGFSAAGLGFSMHII